MQDDLSANYPHLNIRILGINEAGEEAGNAVATEARDIPWLQDLDADQDGLSDVWTSWNVAWRDVVILDGDNTKLESFSLTVNDLRDAGNYTTLLVAPVALGISVDDTMHLVTRYRHEFLRCGSYAEALRASMRDVGRALFITSVVLVAGFLCSVFSVLDSQAHFGVLLAVTIVVALVANFLLMPALILTFKPFGPERVGGGTHRQRG